MVLVNLSFDYEMSWGLLSDKAIDLMEERFKEDVLLGNENVPSVLKELNEHSIPSTWGIVAATSYRNWDELKSETESLQQNLKRKKIFDFDGYQKMFSDGKLFFSQEIVKEIVHNKNVEVVSHGGYHLYLADSRVSDQMVSNDTIFSLKRLTNIAGRTVNRFIAPRNQVEKWNILKKAGIEVVRPNPLIFGNVKYSSTGRIAGLARLYSDIIHSSSSIHREKKAALIFLRIDRGDFLFNLQLRRLKSFLTDQGNDICYFLYIHPHNFPRIRELDRLKQIISLLSELRNENKIQFCDLAGDVFCKDEDK